MARSFAAATGQWLDYSTALTTGAVPISMAARFKGALIQAATGLVGCYKTSADSWHYLAVVGNNVWARSYDGGAGIGNAAGVTAATANVWQSAVGVWAATNDRKVYLNGALDASNTTVVTVTGLNLTRLGAIYYSGGPQFFNGELADVAIWNVALSADEALAYGRGVSPLLIRPGGLLAYWPLHGVGEEFRSGSTLGVFTTTRSIIVGAPRAWGILGIADRSGVVPGGGTNAVVRVDAGSTASMALLDTDGPVSAGSLSMTATIHGGSA